MEEGTKFVLFTRALAALLIVSAFLAICCMSASFTPCAKNNLYMLRLDTVSQAVARPSTCCSTTL